MSFYKEGDEWFIDLPQWEGDKLDLQMVNGADRMLDIITDGDDKVILGISTDRIILPSGILHKVMEDVDGGAYYHLTTWKKRELNMQVWLCPVAEFVFGEYPETIYIE